MFGVIFPNMAKKTRPPVWIGHMTQKVSNVKKMEAFYRKLGLRPIMKRTDMAIFELRGGTHLIIFDKKKHSRVPHQKFDIMVDDLKKFHTSLKRKRLKVGKVSKGYIHETFVVTTPEGSKLSINSSHTGGRLV